MPTHHLLIKGKVQGVFYRASAKEVADALGIGGWIKNTPEGYVEALVSGTSYQLEDFLTWCRKGPERATVTSIVVEEREEESFESFNVLRG